MTIIPPPAGVNFGFVSGRFALAVADTAQDDDHLPNFVPASGTISFRPSNGRILTSNPPRYIAPQTVVATLNSAGAISDGNGNSGIWLVVGVYTVSFKLAGLTVQSFDVEVTSAHNESTPLDLVLHTPAPIEPNVKFVVNEQVYTETLAARDEVVALLEGLEGGVGAGIDDAAVNTVSTWSSAKIVGDLSVKVPETRTVAGKPLSSNVTLAKGDVGLGNVDNTSDASKPVSTATQAALDLKADGTALASYVPATRTVAGKALSANVTLAKADVGLGNVDNTSDAAKPISTAVQTALDAKAASSHTHSTAQVTGLDTALAGKATAAQGAKADTAVQPAALTAVETIALNRVRYDYTPQGLTATEKQNARTNQFAVGSPSWSVKNIEYVQTLPGTLVDGTLYLTPKA